MVKHRKMETVQKGITMFWLIETSRADGAAGRSTGFSFTVSPEQLHLNHYNQSELNTATDNHKVRVYTAYISRKSF